MAEITQQLPHIYHRKKMSPSPLADQTINFQLARSKTSSFTIHYSPFTTTLERNAHSRPQFDPKSNPFWPQTTPKHTQQLRRPVFYDRFSLSPPPLSNEMPTWLSKNAFGSRVIATFVKNDTTLQPNARFSHFWGSRGTPQSPKTTPELQEVSQSSK